MLPALWRMRDGAAFRQTTRRGRKSVSPFLVMHVAPATDLSVGFVVSKAVGSAVTRNRVKRRLRHLVREALMQEIAPDASSRVASGGAHVVVRARPAAALASSEELSAAIRDGLRGVGLREPSRQAGRPT